MKKLVLKSLLITLLLWIIHQGTLAATDENKQVQGIDLEQAEQALNGENHVDLSEQVKVEMKENSEENPQV